MQNKTSENIIGPDLNEYRGEVNYSLLATKTNYAYLRGSGNGSGRFRVDRKFIEYVQGLNSVGIKTGAYHYAVPSTDLTTADSQCDSFINILQQAYGEGNYGDLFPVIDIEAPVDKSISTDALLDWVDRFRKRFERKTRRKMMLYTGAFFIELYNNFYHTKKGFILSDMPLWIAMYPEFPSNPPYPKDQGGWTRWRMWQFTENGTIAGVNPPVDLNYGPTNLDFLTQPDNVQGFSAVGVGQSIRLTWSPNTDLDLGGYNIFLNANYVTTVGKNATTYTIELGTAPKSGTKYEVAIEAFDTDGDFSPNRTKKVVTFVRYSSDESMIIENKENNDSYIDDYDDFLEYYDLERYSDKDHKEKGYKDPVDNLERKFLLINEEVDECKKSKISKEKVQENLEQISEENNNYRYTDFTELNYEFDDAAYLERLEEETAYKNYYGNMNSEKDEERHKKKHKECNDNDDSDSDSDDDEFDECSCKDKKEPKDKGETEKKNPVCKKVYEGVKIEAIIKNCENDREDLNESGEFIYKEKYEGDRRRVENKGDTNNFNYQKECNLYSDNDYLIRDMYLENCDYGYKKHKSKKHDDEYHHKRSKKKKHRN